MSRPCNIGSMRRGVGTSAGWWRRRRFRRHVTDARDNPPEAAVDTATQSLALNFGELPRLSYAIITEITPKLCGEKEKKKF